MHIDWWSIQIPIPLALAAIALLGYMVSRWHRPATNDTAACSRRELKRAQSVITEMDRITWTLSQGLARHHACMSKFKEQVGRLSDRQEEAAWKDLCREAENVLKPTLKLATQIAGAYDEIRQQSTALMTFNEVRADPLTGVNNRRGLDNALNAQLSLMNRYHASFSLVMFDVDHFKQVNDRDGHMHGDRILQELARLLEEHVRDTDIIGRYGGDEFVIVMPQTDLVGASTFSERLRFQVASRLTITISGGVAEAVQGDTSETLLARADSALYSAKEAGRNCVFCRMGDVTQPIAPQKAEQQRTFWTADPAPAGGVSTNVPSLPFGEGPGVSA
jgi:diguanylate cyclase